MDWSYKAKEKPSSQGARPLVVAWVPTGAPPLRVPTVRVTPAAFLYPIQIPWSFISILLIKLMSAKFNQYVLPT